MSAPDVNLSKLEAEITKPEKSYAPKRAQGLIIMISEVRQVLENAFDRLDEIEKRLRDYHDINARFINGDPK